MLMTHYREPIDFSVRRLEEAENILAKWRRANVDAEPAADGEVADILADDLNTPALVQWLTANAGRPDGGAWTLARDLLGVSLAPLGDAAPAPGLAEAIGRRLAFIREKNWAEADRIRDELLAQGIQLKDGKDPATGERVTTWEAVR